MKISYNWLKKYVDTNIREVLTGGSDWESLGNDKLSGVVPSLQAVLDLLRRYSIIK